jgi:hypothetical protein
MFGDGALLFREFAMGEVRAYHQRRGKPKSFTDLRDIAVLFLAFPELKMDPGPVRDRLEAQGADPSILSTWTEIAAREVLPEDEDDEFQP